MPSFRRLGLVPLVISFGCFHPGDAEVGASDTEVGSSSSSASVGTTEPTSGTQGTNDTTTAPTTASSTDPSETDSETDPTDPDTSTGDHPAACDDGEATVGEFCPPTEAEALEAGPGTIKVVVADLFGDDGSLDVAALSRDDSTLHLWINDGAGALAEGDTQAVSEGSCGLAAADGEGDGDVDLVVLGESLVALVNDDEAGAFVRTDSVPDGFGGCGLHNSVDVLNDNGGPLDVVTSGAYNNSYSPGVAPPSGWAFAAATGIGGVTEGASGVHVTEWAFDEDNVDDVIVLNQYFTTAELFAGDGMGGFTPVGEIDACLGLDGGGGSRFAATGDLDGDGSTDLVVTCMAGNFVVIHGSATAAFEAPIEILLAGAHQPLVADVDNDDDLDVLVTTTQGEAVNVYINDAGISDEPIELATPGEARGLALGDLQGDGAPDILAAWTTDTTSGVAVFRMEP